MINIYYYKTFTDKFVMTHPFMEARDYGYHTGIDWYAYGHKMQRIYNLVAGIIEYVGCGRDYGNFIMIRHNLKFMGGIDEDFYSLYCHMSKTSDNITKKWYSDNTVVSGRLVNPGEALGYFGNTGFSLTRKAIGKGYRHLTEKEKNDPKCKLGVHLHQSFFQFTKDFKLTPLAKEFQIDSQDSLLQKENKIYFNPNIVMHYLERLQGRKGE